MEIEIEGQAYHLVRLTERERELLRLICEAHPTKEIAYRMGIESSTVRSMSSRLEGRLRVTGRTGLFRFGMLYPNAIWRGIVAVTEHAKSCPCGYCSAMSPPMSPPISPTSSPTNAEAA